MTTIDILKKTKAAWQHISNASAEEKNALLLAMADSLQTHQDAILAEIADLAAGHITADELEHIKLAFHSSLCSMGDSLARLEGWYLSGLLQGETVTPQQDWEEIRSITREEVAAAAAALTLDTVFFLQAEGKAGDGDE